MKIIHGDCLEKLKELPENSIDSIVTDPPYGLSFMGKKWDYDVPSEEVWKECLRVLKPGGHLLSFAGSRTYHRMAVRIEDAGFEIRDMIAWIYGQGFPKSLNISLQIKKKYNIGLCTCNVFEPMLKLECNNLKHSYENSNNKRDNISNGYNDGLSFGEKISSQGNDDNEVEKQTKNTNLSPDCTIRKESGVCELSEKDNKKEQGFKKVSESILQSGVCESISENEGLGNTTLRSGVEKDKTTSEGEGQGLSDMQNKTTDGIAGSSLNTVQNGGQELNGKPSGSLSQLPQQDRENNRKRVEQIKNDCNTEEWNNLSRFICSKCYCIKKDIGGTALKPSIEPIVVARKPFKGTVAENVLTHGTGGINIDGCRVGTEQRHNPSAGNKDLENRHTVTPISKHGETDGRDTIGRWPANLIHDGSEEVLECFPMTGPSRAGGKGKPLLLAEGEKDDSTIQERGGYNEPKGSAARFFKECKYTNEDLQGSRLIYQAKASKKDRDEGLDCTRTVKYNGSINPNKELCKEENMVAVQLLQRVISEPELVSFSIGESGVNIMAQCQSGSLSTIKTTISKIIESKILNLLTLSLTSGFTEDASLEKMSGGSHAESVGSLKKWLLTITNGQSALALGASDVALKMLLQIRNEENWNQSRNIHSTVKPTALMRYLVKLVTPPGGTVLDPFTGSGSTGKACKLEGFEFIGIEREEEYVKIAEARIEAVIHQPTLV